MSRGVRAVFPEAEVRRCRSPTAARARWRRWWRPPGDGAPAPVAGPLGEPVEATFGVLGDGATAVVEMAAASGLPLVPEARRDPRLTTTRGTGELVRAALDAGKRRIVIGMGGSATNDGGAGLARALGVRLLDGAGDDLPPGGAALARLARIDLRGLDPRLAARLVVACDVDNPLCGPRGASAVFGPQKGATPEMVDELDAALTASPRWPRHHRARRRGRPPRRRRGGRAGRRTPLLTPAVLRPGSSSCLRPSASPRWSPVRIWSSPARVTPTCRPPSARLRSGWPRGASPVGCRSSASPAGWAMAPTRSWPGAWTPWPAR